MKAVILAGGEGTRLRPLTYTRPKPMIPFMNRPVIEHIVSRLVKQGFKELIITTNYKVEQIRDYFGDGSKWGAELKVLHEEHPLGTAGSVRNAVDHLEETFAVVQGDNISEIDVKELYKDHKRMGGLATISLMDVDDVTHFGIAEMRGDDIVRFKEKPKHGETFSTLANDGIYILEPELLDMIPPGHFDFSRDLFPKMLSEGKRICGSVTHEFWRDVGTPKDYLEATHHLLREKELIGNDCKVGGHVVESVLGDDCVVDGGAEIRNSVLFDHVSVGNGATLKSCIIGSCCKIGMNADIWPGAVIGDCVNIGEGAVIKGDARVGPNVDIPNGKVIDGTIFPEKP